MGPTNKYPPGRTCAAGVQVQAHQPAAAPDIDGAAFPIGRRTQMQSEVCQGG